MASDPMQAACSICGRARAVTPAKCGSYRRHPARLVQKETENGIKGCRETPPVTVPGIPEARNETGLGSNTPAVTGMLNGELTRCTRYVIAGAIMRDVLLFQ